MNYYYKFGRTEKGPVSQEGLVELAQKGAIQPTTLIRSENSDWIPASQIRKLKFLLPHGVVVTSGEARVSTIHPVGENKNWLLWAACLPLILALVMSFFSFHNELGKRSYSHQSGETYERPAATPDMIMWVCAVNVTMFCFVLYGLRSIRDALDAIATKLGSVNDDHQRPKH